MDYLDRVRTNTAPEVNARIDEDTDARIRHYASCSIAAISRRIEELEAEWDMERWLEGNASALALSGVALAALHDRRWLILPAVVLGLLLEHALHGWCPPVPVLRRLGVRTRKEIERERYAMKALRGDFAAVLHPAAPEAAIVAVKR
jgi:hypothetical protein